MSLWRDQPPFRADHVGSLLRPKTLLEARANHARGAISDADLRHLEDAAIREVVKLQEDVGLQGITDGEFRRSSWHMDFIYRIGGVSRAEELTRVRFHNAAGDLEFTPAAHKVTGRLHFRECIFGDDFRFLQSLTTGTPKLTIPSPSMMHYRGGRASVDPAVYPDLEEFWRDLEQVYAREVLELGKLGCRYLQFDDTSLAFLNDPAERRRIDAAGGHGERQHVEYIRHFNAVLARKPPGMTVCTHMCRGNFRSSWVASGSYDHVAEALFSELAVDGFFLEYDDERSGGFEPLRFVPRGKFVVLGLVTTKRPALEQQRELIARVEQAARFVPLEQLCLSPQCGFSSTSEGNALSVDDQVAKLRLIVATAREIWGR
jgi:5-methyltetrahydropteroyltriglutamate--homocysteine methyltransferase